MWIIVLWHLHQGPCLWKLPNGAFPKIKNPFKEGYIGLHRGDMGGVWVSFHFTSFGGPLEDDSPSGIYSGKPSFLEIQGLILWACAACGGLGNQNTTCAAPKPQTLIPKPYTLNNLGIQGTARQG